VPRDLRGGLKTGDRVAKAIQGHFGIEPRARPQDLLDTLRAVKARLHRARNDSLLEKPKHEPRRYGKGSHRPVNGHRQRAGQMVEDLGQGPVAESVHFGRSKVFGIGEKLVEVRVMHAASIGDAPCVDDHATSPASFRNGASTIPKRWQGWDFVEGRSKDGFFAAGVNDF